MIDYLNGQIVGSSLILDTVFWSKLKLYCDHASSGQDLQFVIDTLVRVEERYATSNTETSSTGAYMSHLMNEAEAVILKSMKASINDYFVVCGGYGSTFAIEMAQKFLGTYIPSTTKEQILMASEKTWDDLKRGLRSKCKLPLVIVSHYEHHSDEVAWRDQLCDVIETPPRIDGHVDLDRLETILKKYQGRPIFGSFSAGSNVTGIKTDIVSVASLLKRYKALVLFDYSAIGSYVAIDLSMKAKDGRCLIDGIFISPHRFLGGPGSCGVLVFNRNCYREGHRQNQGGEQTSSRERAGTPGILQIIKAGLAFQLKNALQATIDLKDVEQLEKFHFFARKMRNLRLLGSANEENRVGIISFQIHHDGPKGRRYLHQNLVVKLLNDIFGIQARSDSYCVGSYSHYLLNVDNETMSRTKFWLEAHPEFGDYVKMSGFNIGWARVSLQYTMTPFEMDYLLFALKFLCENGYRLLPVYTFNPVSGQWQHVNHRDQLPVFTFEALYDEQRNYAESEAMRQRLFEKQKIEAVDLLKRLPPLKELDSIPEMPHTFFYVAKGLVIDRHLISSKAVTFSSHFEKEIDDEGNK